LVTRYRTVVCYSFFMWEGIVAEAEEIGLLDLRLLDRDECLPFVRDLSRVITMLESARAEVVARADADQVYEDDQFLNMAQCVAGATNGAVASARRVVQQAHGLAELPATSDALRAGLITMDHAECLMRALNPRTRDAMAVDEASFAVVARNMPAKQFAVKVGNWRAFHDADGGHDPVSTASRLDVKPGVFGRGTLVGDFTPADKRELNAALDPEIDRLFRQEVAAREAGEGLEAAPMRSTLERRAEALMNLVLAAVTGDPNAINPTPRASIGIVVTPKELAAATGGHALDDQAPVDVDEFELACCDAGLYRAVITAQSEAIDLGREVRTASPAQKRLIAARDGGCRVPGCDATARMCHFHHVDFWEHGGQSNIDNYVLICRTHHRQLHKGRWAVAMTTDQQISFSKPDGTRLPKRGYRPPKRIPPLREFDPTAPSGLELLAFLRRDMAMALGVTPPDINPHHRN
jgi:hypothetical protein